MERRENVQSLQEAAIALGDLFLPRRCLVCGRRLGRRERHVCVYCAADLPLTGYWLRLHNPMADRFNGKIEEMADTERAVLPADRFNGKIEERYVYAAALFFYHGDAGYKRIPQALKYLSDIPAGRFFAKQLGARLAAAAHFNDVDTVIPVPLHWSRRWSRGYNQAEIIARELAASLRAALCTDILCRPRRTKTQTQLSVAEKAANVRSAFQIRPSAALPPVRHLLLVDDVFTTGATLHACYRALRTVYAPSTRISIATLAVVDH